MDSSPVGKVRLKWRKHELGAMLHWSVCRVTKINSCSPLAIGAEEPDRLDRYRVCILPALKDQWVHRAGTPMCMHLHILGGLCHENPKLPKKFGTKALDLVADGKRRCSLAIDSQPELYGLDTSDYYRKRELTSSFGKEGI